MRFVYNWCMPEHGNTYVSFQSGGCEFFDDFKAMHSNTLSS